MTSVVLVISVAKAFAWGQTRFDAQQADRQLNQSYQQAMRQLTLVKQKNLRDAQRAWLSFVAKDSRAMRMAAQALGIPFSKCEEIEVGEVQSRTVDFSYQTQPDSGQAVDGHLGRVDADLNAVYQRCLAMLPPAAQTALREAQRAWVEYRDANRGLGVEYVSGLTVRRSDQLTEFYITGTAPQLNENSPRKSERTPPDPFERAR